MKNILCYGDSITWGLVPASKFERYEFENRWPGVLQNLIGTDFRIIEEALCARTLDTDDPRRGFEMRNGLTILPAILDAHYPLDLIIIMLGTNELKSIYSFTENDIQEKLTKLVLSIKNREPNFHKVDQKILLVTPPKVIEGKTDVWGDLWQGAERKSEWLSKIYKNVADKTDCAYVDITESVFPGNDGVHLDNAGQHALGTIIFKKVIQIF